MEPLVRCTTTRFQDSFGMYSFRRFLDLTNNTVSISASLENWRRLISGDLLHRPGTLSSVLRLAIVLAQSFYNGAKAAKHGHVAPVCVLSFYQVMLRRWFMIVVRGDVLRIAND